MKRNIARILSLALCACMLLSACGSKGVKLDPKNPVTVTVWHYYNGAQQEAFSALVEEFNSTAGADEGIYVEEYSQGSVTDLEQSVLDAANKKVGAAQMPNVFAAYQDTAYEVDQLGLAVDLSAYLTEEEQAKYVDAYFEEGQFTADGGMKIFPVAKSTELLLVDKTDWDKFADAAGADFSDLATIEGVTETAKAYYAWTDAQTPDAANDGKAFFGRDAFANYMLIGALQQGDEIFAVQDGVCTLNFDHDVVRKLWDNYYVPMVAGWFTAENRFRSDDLKGGKLVAYVGSSSSATYFPDSCVISDTESYPIEMAVMAAPQFAGGDACAVQQGAGMVVAQASEEEMYASVKFLKWFTDTARNALFAAESGYLPVTDEANSAAYINDFIAANSTDSRVAEILSAAIDTTASNRLYTTHAFANGNEARELLDSSMPDKAAADRAAFLELLAQGTSYDEALAQFDTDENFEQWYEQTLGELEQLTANK